MSKTFKKIRFMESDDLGYDDLVEELRRKMQDKRKRRRYERALKTREIEQIKKIDEDA